MYICTECITESQSTSGSKYVEKLVLIKLPNRQRSDSGLKVKNSCHASVLLAHRPVSYAMTFFQFSFVDDTLRLLILSCSIQLSSCYTVLHNNGLADKTSTEPGLTHTHTHTTLFCSR